VPKLRDVQGGSQGTIQENVLMSNPEGQMLTRNLRKLVSHHPHRQQEDYGRIYFVSQQDTQRLQLDRQFFYIRASSNERQWSCRPLYLLQRSRRNDTHRGKQANINQLSPTQSHNRRHEGEFKAPSCNTTSCPNCPEANILNCQKFRVYPRCSIKRISLLNCEADFANKLNDTE
jgi:hypothetical protein